MAILLGQAIPEKLTGPLEGAVGIMLVGLGIHVLWRLWRDRASWTPSHSRAILGGILVGVGGFNTYDGVVQHVLLHLHLVNEHVCTVPQDPNNSILSCRADR